MNLFKKSFILLGLSVITFSIVSCNKNADTDKFEIKNVNVYREKNKIDKTFPVRLYENKPNVLYVSIKEYFKEFYNTELKINKINDYNVFSKDNNEYIKINSKNNIIGIKDTFKLGHHPDFKENTNKTFLKLESTSSNPSSFKMIDLNKYEMKLYSDDADSFIPFGMLNNLYGN